MEYSYTVLFEPAEEGGYVAFCPALPGLVTEGDSYEEVRDRVKEAIEGYLESLQKDGQPSPPDKKAPIRSENCRAPMTVHIDHRASERAEKSLVAFEKGLAADPSYSKGMARTKSIDPFICNDPAVEISPATIRILKLRMKTADEGHLVSAEKARQRIQQWLSKSSTTKTR